MSFDPNLIELTADVYIIVVYLFLTDVLSGPSSGPG